MKPTQLRLIQQPGTGRSFIVHEKPGSRPVPIKDVTADYVLMQAAEILREDGSGIETVYEVTHPNGDVIEIEITAKIIRNVRGTAA